jgi:hypothetical protein
MFQLWLCFSPLPFNEISMSLTPNGDLARERFQIRREEEVRPPLNIKFPILQLVLAAKGKIYPRILEIEAV